MFSNRSQEGWFASGFTLTELIYHSAVRSVRMQHGNAMLGLLMNILQTLMLVAVFYAMYLFAGWGGNGIRGDFLLYIMSGIFLFMTHTKTMSAVVGAEGPSSPMMKHAPMNTAVSIGAAALSSLYIQVLTLVLILFIYDVTVTPITIDQPVYAFGMLMLAWFAGLAIGLVLLAAKPWAPQFVGIFTQIYQRANMIASGKMFVANALPGFMLPYFIWNPLFHIIDQARGFAFLNYNPHYPSLTYPVAVTFAMLLLGLMGEFYTRQHASVSWEAGR